MEITTSSNPKPRRRPVHRAWACLLACTLPAMASAQAEVVQGNLELQWGDARGAAGKSAPPGRFRATLVTDDGVRHALDPAQSRKAAGDLYALANRRVAVEFSASARPGALRRVDTLVPADRPWLDNPSDSAKLMEKAVLGNTRWVTIACRFSDIAAEQKPVGFFQQQYGTAAGQLGHYWNEVSYGKISLTNSIAVGWLVLPHPRSHYVTDDGGGEDADLDAIFDDCTAAADPQVDFSNVQGINLMLNGDLDGYAWGGGACGVLEGVNTCIRSTWNPPWAFQNLAPLAHEMGHGYGLPHSDNSDGDDDTYDNPWDVMSDGWSNAVSNATYGSLPKHINVKQRERLGWIDAARKLEIAARGSAANVKLDRASLAGSANRQMIVLSLPAQDAAGKVSYTVEARGKVGTYEANLAGDAVVIHGINAGGTAYSVDTDLPPANRSNNEGSMFKPGETWISPDGTQRVKVVSATATGFIVTIGWPRVNGGVSPPRTSGTSAAARQRSAPVRRSTPAARDCGKAAPAAHPSPECMDARR